MNYYKLRKFIKTWNESIGLIISLIVFFVSPILIRALDPGAGAFDSGVLQVAIVSLVLFQFSGIVAWFTFRWNFPRLYRWFDDVMEDDLSVNGGTMFDREPVVFRTKVVLSIYFLYFILMVLTSMAFIAMDVTY